MISKESLGDLYTLTPMQEGMLFHALLDGGSRAYHEQVVYELSGPFDPASFERAWQTLVDRHDVLRTVFVYEKAKRPLQAVLKQAVLPFSFEDVSGLPSTERRAAVDAYLAQDRARGFDLNREIALRIAVFQLEHARHVVVWSFHHIVLDGWSTGVLVGELARLYDALCRQADPALPSPVPFKRYVAWLEGRDQDASRQFWRDTLSGYEGAITIPGAAGRPHADAYEHAEVVVDVDGSVSKDVQAIAARLQVTPYSLLQTAWSVWLGRANGTGDILFGSVVSGRSPVVPGVEQMVGLLINAVPVRVTFSERDSLETIARRIQQASLDAEPHSFLPLSDTGAGAQVTHVLAFESYPLDIAPAASDRADTLTLDGVRSIERTNYDLTLVVTPGDRLRLTFLFNRLVIAEDAVRALAADLETTLRALVAEPSRTVADTPIVAAAGLQRQLAWSETATDYPSSASIHELFEQCCDAAPDAVAVTAGAASLTYAELNRRANQLAHELRRHGAGPEHIVGVFMGRSAETIVALLAILKAGAAYLGIEPDWPEERIRWVLEDAGVTLVVTNDPLAPFLVASGRHVVSVADTALWPAPDTAVRVPVSARNLAYVSYTSGSTGRPKGVAVEHRSVARLVRDTDFAVFGPGRAFLQYAPLSFDASTFELWGALLNGGRVAVVTEPRPTLEQLGVVIRDQRVDTLWLTAGLFHAMVDERLEDFAGVTQCLAGGDVLSPAHVRRILDAIPGLAVINGYGPTEGTTFTCCHGMTGSTAVDTPVPIGRPIANTRTYVLDAARRPLPIGAPGELLIAGDGLARGYWKRPALTAERFEPDPFGAPGARTYASGDRVRVRRDGVVEFLGRRDDQVKIRGFRVEPGELEAVLTAMPEVRASAVVAAKDGAGVMALTAYVVAEAGQTCDVDALRRRLETSVPSYLVPAAIVELPSLPLTGNGKVDRKQLAASASPAAAGRSAPAPVEPRTETERRIAEVWREVLNLERVGVDDNFFELGGHSLAALRVASRLRKALDVEVPLPLLFAAPTIATLAAAVEARAGTESAAARPMTRRARVAVGSDVLSSR